MEAGAPRDAKPGSLFVEFLGKETEIPLGTAWSFGRHADLVVDADNRYLHRVLGVFVAFDSVWVLQNVGRHIAMTVRDRNGPTHVDLAPGDQVALLNEEFTVSFSAGSARYELAGALSSMPPRGQGTEPTDTLEYGTVTLNPEQRQLVSTLAAPLLRGDSDWPASMPSSREAANALGWTVHKLNRKLDYLCSRLAAQGLPGVQGGGSVKATGRRQRLAEHLVERRIITAADLGDPPG